MSKFKIPVGGKDNDSINRTIHWRGNLYDKLMDLSEKHHVSFNRLVNECVQFAIDNLEETEDK